MTKLWVRVWLILMQSTSRPSAILVKISRKLSDVWSTSLFYSTAIAIGNLQEGYGNFYSQTKIATGVTMPDRPARLPPLVGGANLFGPTNMPDRPLHLVPIQQPENGKGKAPISGKLLPKKGTPSNSLNHLSRNSLVVP